jgi:hypothetical protein
LGSQKHPEIKSFEKLRALRARDLTPLYDTLEKPAQYYSFLIFFAPFRPPGDHGRRSAAFGSIHHD